jgi:hypothetical protein
MAVCCHRDRYRRAGKNITRRRARQKKGGILRSPRETASRPFGPTSGECLQRCPGFAVGAGPGTRFRAPGLSQAVCHFCFRVANGVGRATASRAFASGNREHGFCQNAIFPAGAQIWQSVALCLRGSALEPIPQSGLVAAVLTKPMLPRKTTMSRSLARSLDKNKGKRNGFLFFARRNRVSISPCRATNKMSGEPSPRHSWETCDRQPNQHGNSAICPGAAHTGLRGPNRRAAPGPIPLPAGRGGLRLPGATTRPDGARRVPARPG